ncbi:MAG: hypothetical protein CL833_02165 [Crocinitomicaceae bacterium]|nr:hypothetical protein [Crocinitomicaceae bacterium]
MSKEHDLYEEIFKVVKADGGTSEELNEAVHPNVAIGRLRDDYPIEFGDLKRSLGAAKKIASNKKAKGYLKGIDKLVKALEVVISFNKVIDKAYFDSDDA